MTPKEVLIAARELLSDPKRWTRGTWARDSFGRECGAREGDAVCWCIRGAIERCAGPDKAVWRAADKVLWDLLPNSYPADFNDSRRTTHADILALFDRAIARLS